MKKKEPPKLKGIEIDKIDSLESYLWNLGLGAISLTTILKLQEKAESIGIFDDDEIECSKTLKYQIQRVYTAVNDLIIMATKRANVDWPDMVTKIIKNAGAQKPKTKRKK